MAMHLAENVIGLTVLLLQLGTENRLQLNGIIDFPDFT